MYVVRVSVYMMCMYVCTYVMCIIHFFQVFTVCVYVHRYIIIILEFFVCYLNGVYALSMHDYPSTNSIYVYQVKRLTKTNEIRKDFIIMWLSAYEGAVLEYDAEKYTFISFLFEVKGFSIVVHCKWCVRACVRACTCMCIV